MRRPVPEWEKSRVILVEPGIWPEYRRRSGDVRPVMRALAATLGELEVPCRILEKESHPLDLWVRDWGPAEGRWFGFQPSYAKGIYSPADIARSRFTFENELGQRFPHLPLVLDGGNLVHNGRLAVLTEKVLTDNRQLTRKEISRLFLSAGFEQVLFLPVEPGDPVGHSDGLVRFVAPEVLLVNDYEGTELQRYGRQLLACLNRAELEVKIIPFPWFTTGEKRNGIWSAVGCSINFLQTVRGTILPVFGRETDQAALAILRQYTNTPVKTVEATALARHGGVFNCASYTY